jgi:ribosomal protein L19
MGWVQTLSTEDLICFEDKSKAVSIRIESRKTDEGWTIYKTYYNDNGLNHTDEYIAPTLDKMRQIVKSLQTESKPTLSQLRQLMLEKSKKVQIKVERAFKEYNVEKWKFGVNSLGLTNFVLVRCCDEVEIDVVMHESFKNQEEMILDEIIAILGFEGMEESMTVHCYYFSKQVEKQFESAEEPFEFL